MFSAKPGGSTRSLVQSVSGITKTSAALSTEEWDKLEESAERIQKSIVGSLKTILHEVQDVLGNPNQGPLAKSGDGVPIGEGGNAIDEANREGASRGGQETIKAFRALAQQRKADYEDFIACMRQSSAFDLRAKVQRFCKGMLDGQRYERQETVDMVQSAISEFENILLQHTLWATRSEDAQVRALDALEHYILMRLHKRIFAPDLAARQHDAALRMRIAKLQFINPDHLDIPAANRHPAAWQHAIESLQAMSQRQTPLEKLDCILEASRHIYSAPSLHGQSQPISADDFLPVLVYVVLRANPPELQSNVDLVSSYRSYE